MAYYYQAAHYTHRMMLPAPEPVPVVVAKAKPRRRRARHPAGAPGGQGGEFIGDDPATPEDEAWEGGAVEQPR